MYKIIAASLPSEGASHHQTFKFMKNSLQCPFAITSIAGKIVVKFVHSSEELGNGDSVAKALDEFLRRMHKEEGFLNRVVDMAISAQEGADTFEFHNAYLSRAAVQLRKRSWKDWARADDGDHIQFASDFRKVLMELESDKSRRDSAIFCFLWFYINITEVNKQPYAQSLYGKYIHMAADTAFEIESSGKKEISLDEFLDRVLFRPMRNPPPDKDIDQKELEKILDVFEGARINIAPHEKNDKDLEATVHVTPRDDFIEQFDKCTRQLGEFGACGVEKFYACEVVRKMLPVIVIKMRSVRVRIFLHYSQLSQHFTPFADTVYSLAQENRIWFNPRQHVIKLLDILMRDLNLSEEMFRNCTSAKKIVMVRDRGAISVEMHVEGDVLTFGC